jgi:hypothetical protein
MLATGMDMSLAMAQLYARPSTASTKSTDSNGDGHLLLKQYSDKA